MAVVAYDPEKLYSEQIQEVVRNLNGLLEKVRDEYQMKPEISVNENGDGTPIRIVLWKQV